MTNPQVILDHTTNETLAAFADGRLRGAERQSVVEHLAGCDECRDDWQAIAEAKELGVVEGGGEVVRGNFVRRALIGSGAVAAAVVIALLPPVRAEIDSYRTGGVSDLVKASEPLRERDTEARLTGGFSHRGISTKRGPEDEVKSEKWGLLAVAGPLIQVDENASARELRGAGLANLLTGDRKRAVEALERAANAKPNDPAVLSDLAAAYLERGRYGGGDADYNRALAVAERAWTISQEPEIAWNRALARERSGRPDARQAWLEYLQIEPSPAWADEARSRYLDQ